MCLLPAGHIPGTSEVSPKLQFPVEPLVTYLRENHGLTQEGPPVIRQFKHGQSNPTYYIAYGGAELVLRKKPVCLHCCILAHTFAHSHIMLYTHARTYTHTHATHTHTCNTTHKHTQHTTHPHHTTPPHTPNVTHMHHTHTTHTHTHTRY